MEDVTCNRIHGFRRAPPVAMRLRLCGATFFGNGRAARRERINPRVSHSVWLTRMGR